MPERTHITIELDLDKTEAEHILTYSLERVLNTAKRLVAAVDDEAAWVCEQDIQMLKPFLYKVWGKLQDATFRARQ